MSELRICKDLTHWQGLSHGGSYADRPCSFCKIDAKNLKSNSVDHQNCFHKAFDVLKMILPSPPPLEDQREDTQSGSEEPRQMSSAEECIRKWCHETGPKCTRKVLKALLEVYANQDERISKAVYKIENRIVEIIEDNDIAERVVKTLFQRYDTYQSEVQQPVLDRGRSRTPRVVRPSSTTAFISGDSEEVHSSCFEEQLRKETGERAMFADDPASDEECVLGTKQSRRRVTDKDAQEAWGGPQGAVIRIRHILQMILRGRRMDCCRM